MTSTQTKTLATKVDIQLLGKQYAVACEAGEEARVESLAGYVDSKMRMLHGSFSSATQERLFMLTCLMLADEIFDLKSGKKLADGIDTTELVELVESLVEKVNRITLKLQG